MTPTDTFDVVVLGGGPAGTAAALTLRHYSPLTALVIERSDYTGPRIGETLSPGTQGLLGYLKVWEPFLEARHQPAFGTSAAWGSETVQARDFIYTPFGQGWHLDRRRFDRMLADAAIEAGAALWTGAHLRGCTARPGGGWRLNARCPEGTRVVEARFLIDASGKAGGLIKRLGARRWQVDRLVGVAGVLRFAQAAPADTFTLVETCADGWWYSALLPGGTLIVTFMSDVDIVRRLGMQAPEVWRAALALMPHSGARAQGGSLEGGLRIYPAHSARLDQLYGPGWAAAGDAAASHDPLSSSGIPRALDSGIRGARAAYALLHQGDEAGLASYAEGQRESFDLYLTTRARYYAMEQRWPDAPFWRRRQQAIRLDPAGVLHYEPQQDVTDRWAGLIGELPRRAYVELCELCAAPTPAHAVVTAFQQRQQRRPPDQQVILALQDLVERGIVEQTR